MGKIDATANDINHPIVGELTGYPFLAFFPAGDKDNAVTFRVNVDAGEKLEWNNEVTELLRKHAKHGLIESPPTGSTDHAEGESGLLTDMEESAVNHDL